MFKIFLIILALTVFTLADGPILQTGQVKSYDTSGTVVTDGSIKDDGYYQAGKTRSYSHSGDIVSDNVTGLEWQDNETVTKPWLTQENYNAGNYEDTSGDTATTYCINLPLDGGGWQLPTIEELETLVDVGKYNPSVTENVFQHIYSDNYYWSSTTSAYNTSDAWPMAFRYGISTIRIKTANYYVRCVRGGQLTPPDLSRNNVTEIVTDSTTGLQWQDNEIVKMEKRNWIDAIDYCENDMTLGGYYDWRLPNKKELRSIADRSRQNPSLDMGTFENVSSDTNYWSSTTSVYYPPDVWFVSFFHGVSSNDRRTANYFVRCVRGGQFGYLTCPKGHYSKQGERVCIPGIPVSNLGIWLPRCESGRLIQGQDTGTCDDTATPVAPPGLFLPVCPDGERLNQGTDQCKIVSDI